MAKERSLLNESKKQPDILSADDTMKFILREIETEDEFIEVFGRESGWMLSSIYSSQPTCDREHLMTEPKSDEEETESD